MNRKVFFLSCFLFSFLLHCSGKEISEKVVPGTKKASQSGVPVPIPFADDSHFVKMPPPKKGEWLDRFKEEGQTYLQYISNGDVVKKTKKRNTLYLQPLGGFSPSEKKLVQKLAEFTRIYFQCPVKIKDPLPLSKKHRRKRSIGYQYQTPYILDKILSSRLPADGICYLGITMEDIYPDAGWNYVFGEASLSQRVGVYSLARYFARFWKEKESEKTRKLAFLRSMKVLTHEAGHMFTLEHCIHYLCNLDGSNSLEESDHQPLWLCPVCISKLQWNLKFDPLKRYKELETFLQKEGFDQEARWYKRQRALVAKMWKEGK